MNIGKILLLACFLCFLLLPGLAFGTTATEPQSQTVVMSLEQYNSLKRTISELDVNLKQLENNSKADKRELAELRTELENSKNQISKAENSLNTAEDSLTEQTKHLQILTEQMESLKHKIAVKERQNKLAWITTGLITVWAFSK